MLEEYYDEQTNTLTVPYYFNEEFKYFPKNIKIINFYQYYDNYYDIYYSSLFDKPIDNLPIGLTHLKFGFNFNQSVDNLPETLIYLSFGVSFNQSVNKLPKNLKYLKFSEKFNSFNSRKRFFL